MKEKEYIIEHFEQIWAIMEEAFPLEERRTKEAQRKVLSKERYHMKPFVFQERLVGFTGYWDLDDFYYLEHLATEAAMRGKGIGAELMQFLLESGKPVVLEVEIPENDNPALIENRRIEFYRRLGFHPLPYDYAHPSYHGQGFVPLLVMVNQQGKVTQEEFDKIRETLLQHVVYFEE